MSSVDRVESAQTYEHWVEERKIKDALISQSYRVNNSINSNLETLRCQKDCFDNVCCLETNSGNPDIQLQNIKKIKKVAYETLAKIHEVGFLQPASTDTLQKLQQLDQEIRSIIDTNEQLLTQLERMTPIPNPASIVPLVVLIDPYESAEVKKELCEKIAREPGLYHPLCLYMVGLEYLKIKEFDKAAQFCVAGSFRQETEMRINGDAVSSPIKNCAKTKIFQGKFEVRINGPFDSERFSELKESSPLEIFSKIKAQLSPDEIALWRLAWETAKQNFEAWDRATPRQYNIAPPNAASLEDKKRAMMERFYREVKGKLTEEDLKNASGQDRYFFDPKTRTFYLRESQFSFKLPEIFRPTLNRFGRFEDRILLPNHAVFSVDTTSDDSPSFQKQYDDAVEDLEDLSEGGTIEKGTLNNGTPFYRMRYADSGSVTYDFSFVKRSYIFDFSLTCYPADEQNFLQQVEALLNSIQ